MPDLIAAFSFLFFPVIGNNMRTCNTNHPLFIRAIENGYRVRSPQLTETGSGLHSAVISEQL